MSSILNSFEIWQTGGGEVTYIRRFGFNAQYTFSMSNINDDLPDADQRCLARITDDQVNGDQIAVLEDVPIDRAVAWLEGITTTTIWYEIAGDGEQSSLLFLLSFFAAGKAFGGQAGAVLAGKLAERLLREGSVNGIHDGGRFLIHKWRQFQDASQSA